MMMNCNNSSVEGYFAAAAAAAAADDDDRRSDIWIYRVATTGKIFSFVIITLAPFYTTLVV